MIYSWFYIYCYANNFNKVLSFRTAHSWLPSGSFPNGWLDHTALLSKILGGAWIRTGRCYSPHTISTLIHFRRIRERPRYGRDYVRSVYLPQSWLSRRYQVTRGQTTEGSCPTLRRNTTQIFWRIWATPVSWSSTTPLELWCRLARNVSTRQLLLFTIIRYYTIVPSYCDIVHRAPS